MDDFDRLKQVFFSEVNRFKEELLESYIVDRPQKRLVKQLQDHTEFLREELRNKNNMINYRRVATQFSLIKIKLTI